jgi:hypothetical protein
MPLKRTLRKRLRRMSDRSAKRWTLRNITVSSDMVNGQLPRSPHAIREIFTCNRTFDPKEVLPRRVLDYGAIKIRTNFR